MDEQFDFVVVGSGGGSMCAGLFMRGEGKSVVILEKTDKLGGTTATAGGVLWIPNNRFMKEAGIEDSYDQAMTYLEATAGQSDADSKGTSRERRAAYVTEGPKMIDFLVDQGVQLRRVPYWPDYYDDRPGGSEAGRTVVAELFNVNELPPEWRDKLRPNFMQIPVRLEEGMALPTFKYSWHGKRILARMLGRSFLAKLTGKKWVTAGAALQGRMLQAALKAGVEFRTEAPVNELIVEQGRVVGVRTMKDGKPWTIGATRGVLLNAGGFSRNQKMRDKYIPKTSAQWTNASKGDTGEIIEEAQRIGAAVSQMGERVGNQMTLPPVHKEDMLPMVQMDGSKPHAILVDQSAQRYLNEGGSYMEYGQNMLRRDKDVPAIPSWMIVDDQYMSRYMFSGTMPGSKKPQDWFDSGFLKKANTIADLALQCGLDPAALRATVDRFNGFVAKGVDEDFGRGARAYDRYLGDSYKLHAALGTIEKGPFYAVQVWPGDVGTYGGVVTDVNARVLREDGSVIEGLYATGTTTASVMGQSYPGAGSSIGPSFTWGYVAAKHAAGAHNSAG
jgi:3-oxosteroid 1-dehydrogenase